MSSTSGQLVFSPSESFFEGKLCRITRGWIEKRVTSMLVGLCGLHGGPEDSRSMRFVEPGTELGTDAGAESGMECLVRILVCSKYDSASPET